MSDMPGCLVEHAPAMSSGRWGSYMAGLAGSCGAAGASGPGAGAVIAEGAGGPR
ncbi:hypothetical protein ACSRUE_10040 [Sorangium sp. KYC3313]|uniref:hypothetical protein n=1 Tax=Sorangium sp. KYC3313 TaxID=3449740 RepID=UPI003F8A2E27